MNSKASIGRLGQLSLVCILLAACGTPPDPVSVMRRDADRYVSRARRESSEGNWQEAQQAWRDAGLRFAALDDRQGVGESRLGVALVMHRQGRFVEAKQQLEQMLADAAGYPETIQFEVHLQLALLDVRGGLYTAAAERFGQAEALCNAGCGRRAALYNGKARLVIQQSHFDDAKRLATIALQAAGSDKAESANAQRLLGQIAIQQQDWAGAHTLLEAALTADKQIGDPSRISKDLALLHKLAHSQGDQAAATSLLARLTALCQSLVTPPADCSATDN